MSSAELFEREREELTGLLAVKKRVFDGEVTTILETFLEMLSNFPMSVVEFDLAALQEFMAEKAENFYRQFKSRQEKREDADRVLIVQDKIYIFEISSISLNYGSLSLFYPYMLVRVANYSKFILLLCQRLKKSEISRVTLVDFLKLFYELSVRCRPNLTKWDLDLMRELTAIDFSKVDYATIARKYDNKKRFVRLKRLRVMAFYHNVNFSVLGLVPYIHLADHKERIPEDLKPFIEIENWPAGRKRGFRVFRLFLLPIEQEREWVACLKELGETGKINEWYSRYNLDTLTRTKTGGWKWELDFSDLNKRSIDECGKYNYYLGHQQLVNVTDRFINYLEAVHKRGSMKTSELAFTTDISEHTIKKYHKRSLEESCILPELFISRINLDSYYQLCFKKNELNWPLVAFLETFPKIKAMKSEEFYRYLLFLPRVATNKLNDRLIAGEEKNEFTILSKEIISFDARTIDKGVDLCHAWKLKSSTS
ncbi:MAG: hypothetical protein ACFFD4_00650 [Candidatus Odinarchaeota archaeon]